MSFIVKNLLKQAHQPSLICNLASSFRSLSLTSSFFQRRCATPVAVQVLPKSTEIDKNYLKVSSEEKNKCLEVFNNVNKQLAAGEEGRLFAVVHLCGKQFKVTSGDIILVEGYWPPNVGDKIRLEKVLLAGAKDFTLIGRPILDSDLVNVKATVIEKTLTHTKTHFKKKRRKQYLRINFQRSPNTMIRINEIEIARNINEGKGNTSDLRLF